MRFSKRIYALRDAVCKGESVADIGTDHGYVPMLLVRDEISPYVVMSDISKDSLSKAVETFSVVGIPADESQFRVGDGISTIQAAEVDDLIIAGLGGYTIRNILADDIDKTRSFSKLILQPRKYSGSLRYWLHHNGFRIINETLTSEGKFVCEIITAVPDNDMEFSCNYHEDDIHWAYPESLKNCDQNLLKKRIGWKLGSIQEQLDNLSNSGKEHGELESRLRADYQYLSSLIGNE